MGYFHAKKFNLYLILGLGIGITFSSLFFLLITSQKAISDQEVIQRATELGMVTEQKYLQLKNQLEQFPVDDSINQSPEKTKEMITLTIPAGANSSQIGILLFNEGVIGEVETFRLLVDVFNVEKNFIAGIYGLEQDMDMGELILVLTGIKK